MNFADRLSLTCRYVARVDGAVAIRREKDSVWKGRPLSLFLYLSFAPSLAVV